MCSPASRSLDYTHSPSLFQASSKQAPLLPTLDPFFPCEKGTSHQVSVEQVLNRLSHGQKPQNLFKYTTEPRVDLMNLSISINIIPCYWKSVEMGTANCMSRYPPLCSLH